MGNGVRAGRVYHFGTFTVDARTGELSHDGRRTALILSPGRCVLPDRRQWGWAVQL